jgi:hypothetical protein
MIFVGNRAVKIYTMVIKRIFYLAAIFCFSGAVPAGAQARTDSMEFRPVLCAQYPSKMVKYVVDPSIRSDVNENMKGIKSEPGLMSVKRSKEATHGGEIAFISVKIKVSGDTMILFGCPAPTPAFGYSICIIGDSCKMFYFQMVVSGPNDPGLYKLHSADTSYQTQLLIPTQLCKLTLTKRPDFKNKDEIIEGLVELESYPFFVRGDNCPDQQCSGYLRGYFRTETPPN